MTASVIDVQTDQMTSASIQAASNWDRNVRDLSSNQPSIADRVRDGNTNDLQWLFGRDGSLTAIVDDAWISGCSLPTRAAQQMLKDFSFAGVVGCFLDPPHAAAIRVALDRLRASQAIVVVQPNLASLAIALRCEDFSADITAGRLWFVAGDKWAESLAELFVTQPSLPTPGHFIRLPVSNAETIERLVSDAQKAFAVENTRRAGRVRTLRTQWNAKPTSSPTLLVLKPTQFELWNDAGITLAETLRANDPSERDLAFLELDNPRFASPLMLAERATGATAIVAADIARADAPGVIADEMPWITWITKGEIPPAVTAGPNDQLLVTEPAWLKLAAEAHWPPDRVHVVGWPQWISINVPNPNSSQVAIVIESTLKIVAPEKLDDYSSHRLLWDGIFHELSRDPTVASANPSAYLSRKARQAGIDSRGFDPALFLDRLIYPAIQQATARSLIAEGVPIQLHGRGWADIEEFASIASGPVTSRDNLHSLVKSAKAIVQLRPSTEAHPLDVAELAFIRTARKSLPAIVRETRDALNTPGAPRSKISANSTALSLAKILSFANLS